MGQSGSSHDRKNSRHEKTSPFHHKGVSHNIDFLHEDIDEESEHPSINSRHSYSPNESIPTFPFNTTGSTERRESLTNKKIPVVFRYLVKTNKDVQLIGTFTNWKEKVGMVKSDGDHVAIVDLPEGEHQFKFVIDGKWEHDPNQAAIDDNYSGKNNLVVVKKSDFEVMDALEMDSIKSEAERAVSCADDLSSSPPGEYTDEFPVRGVNNFGIDKPPYLPPQLLNIVLNKDTAAKCEPSLLPEPNHVMLKHLYALSIRDGVMVLSSTFRFKKKFVTTCFYKPI
jgi:5'-AMP-activated protein kinase regulatory beta subunit